MIRIPGGILVSGNLVQDIVVSPIEEVRFGGTVWVERMEEHMGGNGANTSFAAALLGAHVKLIGMVGCDPFGRAIRERLSQVDLSLLLTGEGATASSVVLVRQDGARAFLHRPGVSHEAFASGFGFTASVVEGCSHYHLANPFSLPHVRAIAGRFLADAHGLGLTTSLDTAWDSKNEWMKVLEPCLPYLNLLFVNEDEARLLTGSADPQIAAAAFGVPSVVVKLGARGCLVYDGGVYAEYPAFPVKVVDTTGAGDCFAGGFLAGLAHGFAVGRAARLANAVGALSVSRLGSTAGLMGLNETMALFSV